VVGDHHEADVDSVAEVIDTADATHAKVQRVVTNVSGLQLRVET
jgi:hypothetical protein